MSLYHVLFREVSYYVWAFYACFLRGAFIDSVARLELCTSCHYGCLGDHEGMGANQWAPSHDSVGEACFEWCGLDGDRRIMNVG